MSEPCFAAPPPVPEDPPAEEEPFELPTLEEVARATGTLQPQPLGTHVMSQYLRELASISATSCHRYCYVFDVCMCVPVASQSHNEEQLYQEKEVDRNNKDEVLLNVIRPDYERPAPPPPMEPLYDLRDDGKVQGKH